VLATEIDWRHHIHLESVECAEPPERFNIAATTATEPVIVPDDELPQCTPFEQHIADELLGRESGQVPVEPHEEHVVQWREGQNLQPLRAGGQERWCSSRVYDF
jgi:hypothetical protein